MKATKKTIRKAARVFNVDTSIIKEMDYTDDQLRLNVDFHIFLEKANPKQLSEMKRVLDLAT